MLSDFQIPCLHEDHDRHRGFSSLLCDLLDAVERGERVTIVRGNHPVAEIGPAHRRTGADLRTALEDSTPPDETFARSISAALSMVTSEVSDPWADA